MRVAIWKSWAALRSLRRLSPSSGALFSTSSSRTQSPSQHLARRLDGLNQPTVWHEFSPLAAEYEAINLGQGFPDWQPPPFVQQAMVEAVTQSGANQYARSAAHLPLAQVLVEDYQTRWKMSEPMDPLTQVATTVGCTNALYCAMQGLVNPGDEVILLEPAFDIYDAAVRMAGGTSVFVPLRPIIELASSPDTSNATTTTTTTTTSASQVFTLDMEELAAAITDQTKVLLLNSPHNPTGKMFSRPELEQIAAVVRQYPQIIILSDEVYEHIVFDPVHEPHVSMATVLWDQTLTLSSAGKTFSCTGWKVGWAVGPAHLVQAVTSVQQWTTFSVPTPNQEAIASVLRQARKPYVDEASGERYDTYYDYVAALYKGKRKLWLGGGPTARRLFYHGRYECVGRGPTAVTCLSTNHGRHADPTHAPGLGPESMVNPRGGRDGHSTLGLLLDAQCTAGAQFFTLCLLQTRRDLARGAPEIGRILWPARRIMYVRWAIQGTQECVVSLFFIGSRLE
jgi:aspartate/methionine/tyrosine aminotransferase